MGYTAKKIDALHNWCLGRILHNNADSYTRPNHVVGDKSVQEYGLHILGRICLQQRGSISYTSQPLLSDTIRRRRLRFFGHLCRADTSQDHFLAHHVCILQKTGDAERCFMT